VAGQRLAARLGDFVYDPFVAQEANSSGGDLTVHYAVPLIDESGVYMAFKTGTYVPCSPKAAGGDRGLDSRRVFARLSRPVRFEPR